MKVKTDREKFEQLLLKKKKISDKTRSELLNENKYLRKKMLFIKNNIPTELWGKIIKSFNKEC